MASMPKAMKTREAEIQEESGSDGFRLLDYVIEEINDHQRSLADVATEIDVPRPTLERWMGECGYEYELQKRMVPIKAIATGGKSR